MGKEMMMLKDVESQDWDSTLKQATTEKDESNSTGAAGLVDIG